MDSVNKLELPSLLPVLPVRNTVLFPNAAIPLIVGRAKSISAIAEAQKGSSLLLVLAQKDGSIDEPVHEDLHRTGVVCLISKVAQTNAESYHLLANGLFRYRVTEFLDCDGYLAARGHQMHTLPAKGPRIDALAEEIQGLGKAILALTSIPGSDSLSKLFSQIQDAEQIADLCCTFVNISVELKQELLQCVDLETRLTRLLQLMLKEKERVALQSEMQSKMMERLSKDQRDHLLREQIKTIHEELGEDSGSNEDLKRKIERANLPKDALKVAKEEAGRLAVVHRTSPEYHVIRTYLDWILALPWSHGSAPDCGGIDLALAKKILDEDHFGIEKVKTRVLQFLAVNKLKKDLKGPILCLVGPPGVGKTSLGKSIARALGRKFIRTSLGGIRDEAEIRGHRRTYIGAMPGRIMQGLKRCGVNDPLMLLDEVDKIGLDFRGDPASALLEVLDPEQNNTFTDHYVDVPFDLSHVFFILTANVLDTIPAPLRDRMEVIEMSSYSKAEKLEIALRHLAPKLLADHGISPCELSLSREIISLVIEDYTREAGVRHLTRQLAHLCRGAAEKLTASSRPPRVEMGTKEVERILGPRKFFAEVVEERTQPGVATGLAWTPVGGEILHIEVSRLEGKGNLILTGKLGDVMKESAQIALSLLRATWTRPLALRFDKIDFHIHVPSGAIPKDGPSAGVPLFLALVSLVEGKSLPRHIAVTGEVTLRGSVLPVGGIKEKVLAAHRAGIKIVGLPERNIGDLAEVSEDVRNQMQFHFLKHVDDALKLVQITPPPITYPSVPKPGEQQQPGLTN